MSKPIIINKPKKKHFLYVVPIYKGTTESKLFNDPERTFIINNTELKARLLDLIVYPFDSMSEFHCRLAMEHNLAQMQKYLKSKYPGITSKSKIAFLLFEVI